MQEISYFVIWFSKWHIHQPESSLPDPVKASVCACQLVSCASHQSSCHWGRMAASDCGRDHPVPPSAPALEWSLGSWVVKVHEAQGGKFVHERGRGAGLTAWRRGSSLRRVSDSWKQRATVGAGWSRAAPGCWNGQAGWSWSCAAWPGSWADGSQRCCVGRCLRCGTSSSPRPSTRENPEGARWSGSRLARLSRTGTGTVACWGERRGVMTQPQPQSGWGPVTSWWLCLKQSQHPSPSGQNLFAPLAGHPTGSLGWSQLAAAVWHSCDPPRTTGWPLQKNKIHFN